jgi:hypothetical protein
VRKNIATLFCIMALALTTNLFAQERERPPNSTPTGTAVPRENPSPPPQPPPSNTPSQDNARPPDNTSRGTAVPRERPRNRPPYQYPAYEYWRSYPYGYIYPYGYYWYPQPVVYTTSDCPQRGSVRIKGKPKDAEVYVDGGFVGYVDEFDGTFEKLVLEEGLYEFSIKANGYKPIVLKIRIVSGRVMTIRGELQKE